MQSLLCAREEGTWETRSTTLLISNRGTGQK